jgi:hypothetical protein
LHDWEGSFKRSFGIEADGKVTLKKFNHLVKHRSEFRKCTADSLAGWMKENPSAIIVTDIKENNLEALQSLLKVLPQANMRVIPQVYDPENLKTVRALGFEKIIWTLYRYGGRDDEVLAWVDKFHAPLAVTMPKSRAESTLPKELEKRKVPSYVHTVNSAQEADKFMNRYRITELYTDHLHP